jgi:hypothetical protein
VRSRNPVALLAALVLVGLFSGSVPAQATGACSNDAGPAGTPYLVHVCFLMPAEGDPLVGDATVKADVTVTGTNPGIDSVAFRLKNKGATGLGVYLITDMKGAGLPDDQTFQFLLPSYRWSDATRILSAKVHMLDGYTSPAAAIGVDFYNQGADPWQPQTFAPHTPNPATGPLNVAAVGDGAIGNPTAHDVSTEVAALNPDVFLYLADVYQVGSMPEYYNWYGARPGTPACTDPGGCGDWGQFYNITNPTAGVHEYNAPPVPGQASGTSESGYTDYWGMPAGPDNAGNVVRHYYSYDAGGWHFISLDSTDRFRCGTTNPCTETAGWTNEYNWLQSDLAANAGTGCTIAYWHHPYWGMKTHDEDGVPVAGGVDLRLTDMYQAMYDHGVDILLTGHQHNFQRWKPLDPSGAVNQNYGITEIVDGAGGHPFGYYTRTDNRLVSGIDRSGDAFQNGNDVGPSPNRNPAGVIDLKLYSDHADYRYMLAGTNTSQFDSATIPCHAGPSDNTPPGAPTQLHATTGSGSVSLDWTPPSDGDVVGYNIYRATGAPADCSVSCVQIDTTSGSGTSYTDPTAKPGTAYTYGVKARDSSGNVSAMSDPVTVATSTPLFSDDFEGSGSGCAVSPAWTKVIARFVAQPEPGNPGNCEGYAPSTGQNAYASKTLSTSQSDLYVQERFRVMSQSSAVTLLRLKNSGGATVYSLSVGTNGNLNGRNELQNKTTGSGIVVGPGTGWHTLTAHLSIGAPDHVDVWLDGSKVNPLSMDDALGSSQLEIVSVGENQSGRTFQLELDDVKVDSATIPH